MLCCRTPLTDVPSQLHFAMLSASVIKEALHTPRIRAGATRVTSHWLRVLSSLNLSLHPGLVGGQEAPEPTRPHPMRPYPIVPDPALPDLARPSPVPTLGHEKQIFGGVCCFLFRPSPTRPHPARSYPSRPYPALPVSTPLARRYDQNSHSDIIKTMLSRAEVNFLIPLEGPGGTPSRQQELVLSRALPSVSDE